MVNEVSRSDYDREQAPSALYCHPAVEATSRRSISADHKIRVWVRISVDTWSVGGPLTSRSHTMVPHEELVSCIHIIQLLGHKLLHWE